jgi:hypothetical protein
MAASVPRQAQGSTIACAALPVSVASSTSSVGRVVASASSQRTRSAPRLRTGDRERRGRGIDADDVEAARGEQQGERAGAAADVEHAPRAELLRDRHVGVEVGALALEEVVERSEARVGEGGVEHRYFGGSEDA